MSRIIVRNLPEKITKEKLTELFSEKGIVTDVQLKFTKSGKFRKFAFVGFKEESQAECAVNEFNKTFINTSQIQLEICSGLADSDKPRAWSKHTPTSSAFKSSSNEPQVINDEPPTKRKKEKGKKIKDTKVEEMLKSHMGDELFKEYMKSHLPKDEALWENVNECTDANENVNNNTKPADQDISDSQYFKTKIGHSMVEEDKTVSKPAAIPKKIDLFTVKLFGLPYKVKKLNIKKFLHPLKPFSIRIPPKVKGIAYCGFKNSTDMKKALIKNKSFMDGKQILISQQESTHKAKNVNEKWRQQDERLKNEEGIAESGRIFLRNLPYTASEEEITKMFEKYGPISDIILPVDEFTRKPKGFGIVTYLIPEHACKAFNELDGTVFQGRMLHLLPGLPSRNSTEDENTDGSFKQKKLQQQKTSANNSVNWNSFFMSENCLAEAMAASYSTTKEKVLDGSGAAVRLALGETQLVSQTKDFLVEHGVDLESFTNMSKCIRSKTIILVKNLPYGTQTNEIRDKFAAFGELKRLVLPQHGSAGLVEFIEPSEAKKAFLRLAYSKFKHLPLYLEWAPEKVFQHETPITTDSSTTVPVEQQQEEEDSSVSCEPGEGCTLFVKNLNFTTDSAALRNHFSDCGKLASVTVAEKKDPHKPDLKLSMGYGFVTFVSRESADKALKTLQGSSLQDHLIELKRSNRTVATPAGTARKTSSNTNKPSTKMMVRNVPFQATQKELLQLFKTFGEVKALRLPKKMVGSGSHRGFCFVEYSTVKEAKLAFKALSQSTHLYGRRLVIEWASTDDDSVQVIREKTAINFKNSSTVDIGKKKKKNILEDTAEEA